VHYKNLLQLSDMLDVNKDTEKNPENDNSFENYEVEENKRVDGHDVNEETQSLNGQEKLGPLSKKDTTVKWCQVLLAIGVLCFFAYDAIWADPYLAWRYYEVRCCLTFLIIKLKLLLYNLNIFAIQNFIQVK
jgi:hypothetical protein